MLIQNSSDGCSTYFESQFAQLPYGAKINLREDLGIRQPPDNEKVALQPDQDRSAT